MAGARSLLVDRWWSGGRLGCQRWGGVWGSKVWVAGRQGVTCSASACSALVGGGLVPVLLVGSGAFWGVAALSLICASGAGERSGKPRLISPRSLHADMLR